MKIENILERFSCIAFLFKPPCMYENLCSWTKKLKYFSCRTSCSNSHTKIEKHAGC